MHKIIPLTITIDEVDTEVLVGFDYQPEEPTVYYYKDGTGHPGCDAEVELTSVHSHGVDILNSLSIEVQEVIIEQCFEAMEGNGDE